MSKRAQLADGTVLEFPDDTPDSVMDTAVQSHVQRESSLQRSRMDLPLQPTPPSAVGRFNGSLADALMSLPNAIRHPVDTVTSMMNAPMQSFMKAVNAPTKTEAFGHGLAALTGPVGSLAEAIGEQAGKGDVAGAAGTATGIALPALIAKVGPAAGDAVNAASESLSKRLYESALKPAPRSNSLADVRRMINTGLDEGIPVSLGGVKKVGRLGEDLSKQVEGKINAQPGATVNKFNVASRLSDPAQKFATQVNPESDLAAVGESGNEFLRNQPNDIPATLAQKIKQGTYRTLKDKAFGGELKSADVESQKALARGLKEELEAQFPEIQGLNQRQSNLFNLKDDLEAAVNRNANRNLLGFSTPLLGGAVDLATGSGPLGVASMLAKEMFNPAMKSRLAIAMDRGAKPLR